MGDAKEKRDGFSRERRVWIVLSVALLTVLIIMLVKYVHQGEELAATRREGEAPQAKLEAVQDGSSLHGGDVAQLQKKDLSRRDEALATDLMRHKELIPYKGVMGGTMGFYSQNDIHVLTSRWVLATFEDGHVGGHMLLEYRVDSGGEINWRVIEAYLD